MLSRRKPESRKGRITLLNASRRVGKGQPKNYIPEQDIQPLAEMFLKGEPVEGEVAVITREQAAEADYNLSPSRWVGFSQEASLGSIASLLEELQALSYQDAKLTKEVSDMLAPLTKVGSDG